MNQESDPSKVSLPEKGEGWASILVKIVLIGALLAVLAFGTCILMLRH